MTMKKTFFLTIAALLLYIPEGFSWGFRGHKIVAQLSKSCINKSIVDSVQFYLGDTSFEDASVWMDEMRSDHSYDYMKPMHYVNVEKDKTYVKVADPNIINELDLVINDLKNRKGKTKEEIKKNLLILFHLVGDLHQPLHAGYAEDKGGNTVDVDFLGARSNLHKVWDTNIIEEEKITTENCLAVLNTFSEKEKNSMQLINTINWMEDSRSLLAFVYSFKDNTIDKNYIAQAKPIIEKQLTRAGVRLASVLNQTFNKDNKALLLLGEKHSQ